MSKYVLITDYKYVDGDMDETTAVEETVEADSVSVEDGKVLKFVTNGKIVKLYNSTDWHRLTKID
jgi:hypothetical protein